MSEYPLSEYQEKLYHLILAIHEEKNSYHGKVLTSEENNALNRKVEKKIRERYPSGYFAKKEYETLKYWYDNVFEELLSSGMLRKKKTIKPKFKRKICSCRK